MILASAWSRLELRRRWRSLLVLALLVVISTATVLTAVAGARRGDTAVGRLLAATLPADVAILPNQPGFDWEKVRALPEVEALTTFPLSPVGVEGIPISAQVAAGPFDAEAMDTVERPVVLEGRLPDPGRVDEAVITPGFTTHYGYRVGDVVTLRLFDPTVIDTVFATTNEPPEPTGPRITATITGVVRSGWFSDESVDQGTIIPSAAVFARYRANFLGHTGVVPVNALARLHGGEAAMPAFQAALARASGRPDIEVWDMADIARAAQRADAFEAACLLAFGLAALAAAAVLVGQAVARYAAAAAADLAVLRAIGMRRRDALLAACAPPVAAAVLGTAAAAGLAVAASAWMPYGGASVIEPAPGPSVDAVVLGLGSLLAVLGVAATAGVSAGRALRSHPGARPARRSALAAAATRAGLPVPVVVGARFALETGRGPGALSVRPALVGAVTGVLGVLAAFTFSAGVADAGTNPTRFGRTHQVEVLLGTDGQDYFPGHAVLSALAGDPDVTGTVDDVNAVADSGGLTVSTHTFDPVGAPIPTVLTGGRMPATDREVVLAADTARRLDARIGDTVPLAGTRGRVDFTVTGLGFVPIGNHNSYDAGAWLTPAGHAAISDVFKFHTGLVALRPGVDPAAVLPRLGALAAGAAGGAEVPVYPPDPVPQLAQIQRVQVLPVVLGGFLALLAVAAVGHALATAVRRRRHDLAVLRALGMTRGQTRAVVVTQATILAGVGLLLGVPVGVAVGRSVWRVVADITPLQYAAPVALLALLLVAPLAMLVANALAAWPGRQAARLRISHVLRAE